MVIRNTVYLVLAGFIGGLGMLLFTSGRFFAVDSALINATVVFIAWQALGVTVSKLGADQIIFASCVGNRRSVDIRPVVVSKIIPIAAVFAAVSLAKYPALIVVLLFLSIALDAVSILLQAKLNADLEVRKVFAASFLNYPVFLIVLYLVAMLSAVDLTVVALCFCASSLLRFFYLWFFAGAAASPGEASSFKVDGSLVLGAYQGINYWIFKGGQIAAGFAFFSKESATITTFMFFWTAIELIDRFNLAVVPVVYRMLLQTRGGSRVALIAGMSLFLSMLFLAFAWLSASFLGISLAPLYAAALWLNAVLLFFPNYLIFMLIREGNYLKLVQAGLLSSAVATVLLVMLSLSGLPLLALVLYAPCQLVLLCVFSLALQGRTLGRFMHENALTDSV